MVDCGANCAQTTLIESIQTKLSQKPRFSFAKMPTPQKITAIVVTQPAPVVNLIKHHLPEKQPSFWDCSDRWPFSDLPWGPQPKMLNKGKQVRTSPALGFQPFPGTY